MEIRNRWTRDLLFRDAGKTLTETLRNALRLKVLLDNASLFRANLAGEDLSGAQLANAELDFANLRGASLVETRMQGASLRGAILDQANLSRAFLAGADFRRASLRNAAFSKAYLGRALLEKAIFDEATVLSTARGVECRYSFLRRAFKQGVDEKGRVKLCKFVRSDLMDRWNQTVYYSGIVICEDWDPSPWRGCGGGLHFCLTEKDARQHQFPSTLIWAWVHPDDIVVNPTDTSKVRCRKVEVIP